ncbi:HAD family hydrolase [Clostridium hydrogenum]|uniref:HAD family hydrolase n=1 Tax=Clostridium hydrogenum TaxID=2855764 RepID=UPI001F262A40|nr:HAD family hydrolase [Clostridium hydrogenum]
MKIDSIIFDLDGTLWNSIEGVCGAWKTVLSQYPSIKKEITPTDMEGCMGLQIVDIGKKLFPDLEEAFQIKLMKECCSAEQVYLGEHGGSLFPKLEETLKKLAENHKLFIVSNCQDGYIQCFFKAHKLDKYFEDFECSGVTGLPKGENNKLIIKRNNLKNPVYVGDTISDAESAKIAKIPFVYARYGFGDVGEYDYVIDSFEEILNLGL